MKMRADLGKTADSSCKGFRNDSRLQRAQADPFNSCRQLYPGQKIQKLCSRLQSFFPSIRGEMNSGNNHFLYAICGKAPDFFHDLFRVSGADPSSCIRDDAVGAELIAAVLYLDVCAGSSGSLQLHGFKYRMIRQICTGFFLLHPAFQIALHDLRNAGLPVVPDAQIHQRVLLQTLSVGFHIAADGNHQCLRIEMLRPVQHLPALPVRNTGHTAGVDQIQVGLFLKGNHLISCTAQLLYHDIQLIAVYLAAKIVNCCLFHHTLTSL